MPFGAAGLESTRVTAHVALLRGVNVGGHGRVPMKELRGVVFDAGCTDVVTYIQSGNVVFEPPTGMGGVDVAALLGARIAQAFRLPVGVVVRSAHEWEELVGRNPFVVAGADPRTLHVMVLRDEPTRDRVAALDPRGWAPDELEVLGREVYLRYPNGMGRSKLTVDRVERRLSTLATARSWNTVIALLELLRR